MKKRILLIVLALLLAFACMLTACNDKEDDSSSSSSSESSSESQSESSSSSGGNTTVGTSAQVGNAHYLRISNISTNSVTVKFNVYESGLSYDIRWSESEITEENFDDATEANATVSGTDEITAVIKFDSFTASTTNVRYIAVRTYKGNEVGQLLTVRAGGDMLLPIDYTGSIMNVYHGETLHSLAQLFDEQDHDKYVASGIYKPETTLGTLYGQSADNELEGKVGMNISPIIDLEYMHYVTKVSIYYRDNTNNITVRWAQDEVDFQADNDEWDGYYELTPDDLEARSWNTVEIGENARYVQIVFVDGCAPSEIYVYGYQCGEGDPIATTKHALPTIGEMMGMCGFVASGSGNTPITSINCTTVLREYHNFGWSYNEKAYPSIANIFNGTMGNFDALYRSYTSAGILVVPCIQWNTNIARQVDEDGYPIKEGGSFVEAGYYDKFDPDVYFLYADSMFAFAARYGSTSSTELTAILRAHTTTTTKETGAGTIKWLEFGNEPNGEDSRGMVPYQLAALQSAAYDGHEKTMVSTKTSEGYHLGAINADPNMKVAMAGLAGTGGRYITSMCYWLKANRSDGSIAMDAFNFHSYFCTDFLMNGIQVQTGVSPEYFGIVDNISAVIAYRDKYYPDKEVWITEFGWDTCPSYETKTACHAYGEYSAQQVQAMWLTRAYLLFSSCGIDKATMYMCEDGGCDETAVGNCQYGYCGVIGVDREGKQYKKDSYYYLYTLKSTLGDYTFNRELSTGREDVWVYEYINADGKLAYAVWCPTQDGTKVDDFKLQISGTSATLVEAVDEDIDGVSSSLTVSNGTVTFDVSENPVYILVD